MAKKLVIAEKPSVANDIARALGKLEKKKDYYEGDDYLVSSVVGHVVEMYNPNQQTSDRKSVPGMTGKKWSFDSLPALPGEFALRPIKDAEARIKMLDRLARRKDVDGLINACDAGREGELIFTNLVLYLDINKPVQRLWLSSMTASAIRQGFDKLLDAKERQGCGTRR